MRAVMIMRRRAAAARRVPTTVCPVATRAFWNFRNCINGTTATLAHSNKGPLSTEWALLRRANDSGGALETAIRADPLGFGLFPGAQCQMRWYSASGDTSLIPYNSGKVEELVPAQRTDRDAAEAVQVQIKAVEARQSRAALRFRWFDGEIDDNDMQEASKWLESVKNRPTEKQRVALEGELATVAKQIVAVGDEIVEVATETKWLQGMIADADQARAGEFLNGVTSPDKKFELLCAEKVRLDRKEELLLKKELLLGPGVREQLLTQINQLRKKEEQLRGVLVESGSGAEERRKREAAAAKFRQAAIDLGSIPVIPDGEICETFDLPSFAGSLDHPDTVQFVEVKDTCRYFVRHCHEDLSQLIENEVRLRKGTMANVIVLGTPGIGKSLFGLQQLARLLQVQHAKGTGDTSFDIMYQCGQKGSNVRSWLFHRSGHVRYWRGSVERATSKNDWHIVDSSIPIPSEANVLLVTSPDRNVWKEWAKQVKSYEFCMPIFSEDEMVELRKRCSPHLPGGRAFKIAMDTFGGVPRKVLNAVKSVDVFKSECQYLANATTDERIKLHTVRDRMKVKDSKDVSHAVFHIVLPDEFKDPDELKDLAELRDRYTYSGCSMRVASPFARTQVAYFLRQKADAVFDEALRRDELHSAFGKPFELAALPVLGRGGRFRVLQVKQELNEESESVEKWITLPDRADVTLRAEYVHDPLSFSDSGSFLTPEQPNFAVTDAMSVDGLFQVTLSTSRKHRAGEDGGRDIATSMPVDRQKVKRSLPTRQEAWRQLPALWCKMNIDVKADWDGLRKGEVSLPVYYVVPESDIEHADTWETFSATEVDMPTSVTVKKVRRVGNDRAERTIKVTLEPKVLFVRTRYSYWLSGSSPTDDAVQKRVSLFAAALEHPEDSVEEGEGPVPAE